MRSLWSGSIGFGLVNIPVNLYSAIAASDLDLDMLHKTDLSPIRYAKVCKEDGEEVTQDEIVKGVEQEDGQYIVLTNEDFEAAQAQKSRLIDIISFTNVDQVDTIYYEKPYYLEPGKHAEKSYALLREALKEANKVAIAKFVLRDREHLALVKPMDDLLVLNQMRFHEEIRQPGDLNIPKDASVNSKEVKMALALIEQLSDPFDPADFSDTYEDELKEIVATKAKGKKPVAKKTKPVEASNVKDIMALLKASLDKPKANSSKKEASKSNVVGHRRRDSQKVSK